MPRLTGANLKGSRNDVFEIKDFSVATPWEAFVTSLEEGMRAWLDGRVWPATMEQSGLLRCVESVLEHEGGHAYVLSLHGDPHAATKTVDRTEEVLPSFMNEMLEPSSDFTSTAFTLDTSERLRRWFGLRAFVVLAPTDTDSLDAREMTLMQSALNIALASCGCQELPCLVLHEVSQADVYGRALGTSPTVGCRFDAELSRTADVPAVWRSPAGLVALFRSKLPLSAAALSVGPPAETSALSSSASSAAAAAASAAAATSLGDVTLARRHTYLLLSWPRWRRPQLGPPGLLLEMGGASDPLDLTRPLALSAQWPATAVGELRLSSETGAFAESPADAPLWFLRAMADPSRNAFGELQAKARAPLTASVGALLDGWAALDEQAATAGRGPTIESWLDAIRAGGGTLLAPDDLARSLESVARPAAHPPAPHAMVALTTDAAAAAATAAAPGEQAHGEPAFACSGSEYGGLLHRLGLAALRARSNWRAAHAVGTLLELWRELLRLLRQRVESASPLPHVRSRAPVPGTVPVQQQVQLIAMCGALQRGDTLEGQPSTPKRHGGSPKRRKASSIVRRAMLGLTGEEDEDDEDEDEADEEEFAECDDRPVVHLRERAEDEEDEGSAAVKLSMAEAAVTRVGARTPLAGLLGLESQLQLWEPYLQEDPVGALCSGAVLGAMPASSEGPASPTLSTSARDATQTKSEMQAFKAANPGAVLEDFVRWRLPTEWVAGGDGSEAAASSPPVTSSASASASAFEGAVVGQLSEALRKPTDLRQVLWRMVEPVAASEQRPLFNSVRGTSRTRLPSPPPSPRHLLGIPSDAQGFLGRRATRSRRSTGWRRRRRRSCFHS